MADTLNVPVATRVNAGQITVVVNVTGLDAPPRKLTVFRADVDAGQGSIVAVGTENPTATGNRTFTDTSVEANKRYIYRASISALTPGGVWTLTGGPTAWSGYVYSQPNPPGPVTVSRNGTTVTVNWGANAAIGAGSGLSRADNGGAWGAETIYAGSLAGPVALTGVSVTNSCQYRARHYGDSKSNSTASGDRVFTSYVLGPVMAAVLAPLAPTVTAPPLADQTKAITVGVQHQHAGDYHIQTAASLRYRLIGAGSWTTLTLGTAASYTFPANALTAGTYELQAQTQGYAASGYGSWSSSVVVVVTTPPTCNITAPAPGSVFSGARITAQWGYYDAESTPQAGWQLTITDNTTGLVAHTVQGVGATSSVLVPYTLADAGSYTLAVSVQDGAGAWSDPAVSAFTVSYIPTPTPLFTAAWDPDLGAATLALTNPAPGGGQAAAVSNNVYRDGLLIAEAVPVDSVFVDRIPPLGVTVTYRVEAVSATYTTSHADHTLSTTGAECWAFLNGGPGYSVQGRVREGLAITSVPDRPGALVMFEGRELPTEFKGEGRMRTVRVSGDVNTYAADEDTDPLGPRGTWQPFEQLAEALAPLCYRDMLGRRWLCSVDQMTIAVSAQDGATTSVSFVVTQVGDNE